MRKIAIVVFALLFGSSASGASGGRVVVLDPGHGGRLTGTKNDAGESEASITLEIARIAKEELEKRGVKVLMTRTGDQELDLDARVQLANHAKADVFVSVHNNSAPVSQRRGVETYILSPKPSDETTEALMEAENEGDSFGGATGAAADVDVNDPLASILDDLSTTRAHQDSARLARTVQDAVGKAQGLGPSRGLRQAPFRVLRGAKMPAVLVEIGYLSHPHQGALLATGRGQRAAGEALARGISRFFDLEREQ